MPAAVEAIQGAIDCRQCPASHSSEEASKESKDKDNGAGRQSGQWHYSWLLIAAITAGSVSVITTVIP